MTEKIQQYFDSMKDIEENLLTYIEENDQDSNFFNDLDEKKITENKQKLKSFLYLLVHISNNYHRTKDLYDKIDQVLDQYKIPIQNFFKNSEIFHIFHSNKRILLILIQQKHLTINQAIIDFLNQKKFRQDSYIEYLFPEVESFIPELGQKEIKDKVIELKENDLELFNEKRKVGENDSYICSLIRNDQVVDFITYLEKSNISPSSLINMSIYETNHTILRNNQNMSFIEYSAFFGAQQIFQYLLKRNCKLESNIWTYAVHSKNGDLIHFLEENHISTFNNSYQYLVVEAIKCHHNDISSYFHLNFCQKEQIYDQYLLRKYLKYYNFNFENYDANKIIQFAIKSDLFYFFCKYDYDFIVEHLLTIKEIDINRQYKIYKPNSSQKDIVLSIVIKSGDIDKIPKEKNYGWFDDYEEENPKEEEYKEGRNYYIYNYNLDVMTALLIATKKGNIDIIQLLLHSQEIDIGIQFRKYNKSLYDFDEDNFITIIEKRSLLHEAIESGNVDVIQILSSLDKVDFNENIIKTESYIDSRSTAHLCLHNESHKTVLVWAAELGYSEIFKFLVNEKHQSINQESLDVSFEAGGCVSYSMHARRTEKTPLHAAIQNENYNIVKFCLEQPETDVNISLVVFELDSWNNTSFEKYFEEKSKNIIKIMSASDLAVSTGNTSIVHLLLNKSKIDINMKSTLEKKYYEDPIPKKTPLHEAVKNKQVEIIKLLLQQKDIDKNSVDEYGKKPIDYTDDEDIKQLLK
ncbi:hypothetical protein M9Y10_018727 [Tritrichomonas musculus]|uniref:DUF3447 domain-containing protein n=1 Tax=Tritrichomonas musculus TaxID=1915356 RepID=A0ABR2HMF3_9EUKA